MQGDLLSSIIASPRLLRSTFRGIHRYHYRYSQPLELCICRSRNSFDCADVALIDMLRNSFISITVRLVVVLLQLPELYA